MNNRFARLILIIVFAGLVATPVIIKQWTERTESARLASDASEAMTRYGFRFQESAKSSGIDFTHKTPKFDSRLDHIMPEVAVVGASVSVVDYDRDGWPDFYLTNSGEGSKNC